MTLTCNSDANPPVQKCTWYKKTEDETVVIGTGKSINLTLASGDGGLYYSTAWNKVGFQNSSTFRVTLSGISMFPSGYFNVIINGMDCTALKSSLC